MTEHREADDHEVLDELRGYHDWPPDLDALARQVLKVGCLGAAIVAMAPYWAAPKCSSQSGMTVLVM